MKFLNVGTLELAFILLLMLIVLGPRKAIKTAGELGNLIKKFTRSSFWRDLVTTSEEIRDLPRKMMDESELQNTIASLDHKVGEIHEVIGNNQSELHNNLNEISHATKNHPQIYPDKTEEK